MGTILNSRLKGKEQIVFEVLMDYNEAIQLKGQMNNIHLFSENGDGVQINISSRGKNSATKYILIPKEVRKNVRFDKKIHCHKIDLNEKIILVYIVNKF